MRRWMFTLLLTVALTSGPIWVPIWAPAWADANLAAEIRAAEDRFWRVASDSGNRALIAAYLLHFENGAHVPRAMRRYEEAAGEAWTPEVAAIRAWSAGEEETGPDDAVIAGSWAHVATCDFNALLKDIGITSKQQFHPVRPGVLAGESTYRHSALFHGKGPVLELHRKGALVSYVVRAWNNVTGEEIHIGVLNLRTEGGRILSRGWEMNTAGAYCEVTGEKQ